MGLTGLSMKERERSDGEGVRGERMCVRVREREKKRDVERREKQ